MLTALPPSMGVQGNSYHSEAFSEHSKNTLPCAPLGGALGLAEPLVDADGLTDADGLKL